MYDILYLVVNGPVGAWYMMPFFPTDLIGERELALVIEALWAIIPEPFTATLHLLKNRAIKLPFSYLFYTKFS
jgi:hypothetical protein